MKTFFLTISCMLAFALAGYAQKIIPSSIFIIDPQSGAQVPAPGDDALLFKNAFIALVANTNMAKLQAAARFGPGKRSITVTQLDPQANGNVYELSMQRTFLGQSNIVYTFRYNVDQNTLSFFDQNTQNFVAIVVQGDNLINLNNCHAYGAFNVQNAPLANNPAPQPGPGPNQQEANTAADSVTATIAPPPLQEEVQPECPTEGYLWQPGYWAFNLNGGYYWVPGVWLAPPTIGFLWTPSYWAFVNGLYVYNAGYWGNTIGFYGGINYGYGYAGEGFVGGEWYGGHFRYNTAVMRVNANFHYRYVNNNVVFRGTRNRAAFNGRGGIERAPSANENRELSRHRAEVMANRPIHSAGGPLASKGAVSRPLDPNRGPLGPVKGTTDPNRGPLGSKGQVRTPAQKKGGNFFKPMPPVKSKVPVKKS